MKMSAAALLLAVTPVMAFAQAPTEGPKILRDIGFGPAELQSGSAWTSPDGTVRFTTATEGSDAIRLTDLVMSDTLREVRFDMFDVSLSDGSVTFSGMVSRSLLDDNSGKVRISSGSFSDEVLAARLLGGELCPPIGADLDPESRLEIALEGIEMQAMSAVALEPSAVLSGTGRSVRPETISITGLSGAFLGASDLGCVSPEGLTLTDARITAVDGDVGVIDTVSILTRLVATADAPLRLSIEAEGLRLSDSAGAPVAQADRAGLSLAVGDRYAMAMAATLATGVDPAPAEVFAIMAEDTLRIEGHAEGLLLPLSEFLPQDIVARLAIPDGHMVSGDISSSAGTEAGVLAYAHEIDLAGLARSKGNADFTFGDGDNAAAIGAFIEDSPELALAAYLMLKGASFSYEDLGIGPMIEAGTGLTPAEVVDQLRKRVGPLPSALADPVFAWLRDTAREGGKVLAAPAEPVGLVEIGMMGMMNPAGLPELLKLSFD